MSVLVPCSECRRHIVETEPTCPFCHNLAIGAGKLGQLRSVLLASAVAGVSALGCSDERPATKAPPPVEVKPAVVMDAAVPVDATAPAPADAAIPDAGTPDAKLAKKRKKRVEPAPEKRVPLPKMPYGAPPMRRRLV